MTKNNVKLPKWLKDRYDILWIEFKDSPFRTEDAVTVLGKKKGSEKEELLVVLSELRKSKWLTTEIDPLDARKRIYKLKNEEEIYKEKLTLEKDNLSRSDIDKILKRAADLIRTRVDYKFILVILFLKQISDKWESEYDKAYKEAIEDGLTKEDADEEAQDSIYHDFNFSKDYLWNNIRKNVEDLPDKFSSAMKEIAEKNPDLKDVIDSFDFIEFARSRENSEILRQLVELFSEKNLNDPNSDILGDSYEWILSYFAPTKAKEGEVYTPREVIRLLIEILDPKPGDSIYDPASASNGMLIVSYNHVKDNHGDKGADELFLYGQEANQKTLALGKMNLYIHNIKNAHLALGDTLLYPKFKDNGDLKQFDIVIANPPWNQSGYPEESIKKGEFWKKRYNYGFVTKQSADWAWIQHMIASSNEETGKVGVIIDNGALFRGGKENKIRTKLIQKDLLECVILLPDKLFYNTGAPGAILIFNNFKPEDRKNKVLFINASEEFKRHSEIKKLNKLMDDNIEKIVKLYKEYKDDDGLAKIVSLDEISSKDYNLNVSLYAYPLDEIVEINISKEWKELKNLDIELKLIEKEIENYLEELL